ncbi:MAG: ABC transporter permease [Phycisphaerales bacterium]|nr:ABC transporter permease [Phycisphaerales bacterium]
MSDAMPISVSPANALGFVAFRALLWRELARFWRQPARVAASVATPAIIWVVLASGFGESFVLRAGGGGGGVGGGVEGSISYAAYLVVGMSAMTSVFTSIFAAMSLIEDRGEGFLQGAIVSPAPTWAIVGSKIVGSATIASAQSAVMLAAGPLAGLPFHPVSYLIALAAIAMMSLGITGVGLAFAWRVNSTSGFHAVMNLVLMPMLLLSGAFFPAAGASMLMRYAMMLNPLSWPSDLARTALLNGHEAVTPMHWLSGCAFAVVGAAFGWVVLSRGRSK